MERPLLETLFNMSPKGFEEALQCDCSERQAYRASCSPGGSNDKGIDGRGVYKMELLSFPVFFQCKRYRGSVGSGAVRDFRGAMAGRGDKGLLITTGTFTADANAESTRDGAPPVDLIDGLARCVTCSNATSSA